MVNLRYRLVSPALSKISPRHPKIFSTRWEGPRDFATVIILRAADNENEVVFLTAILSGVVLLVASFVVARLNWRPDQPSYNLHTRSLDVLLHPAKYVQAKALRRTRSLQVLGGLLLIVGLLAIACQAVQDFAH